MAGEGPRRLGILALQGAFEEHEASFKQLPAELLQNFEVVRVRKAQQLDECDALVIPGGESTTMKIIGNDNSDSFMTTLRCFVHGGAGSDGVTRPARPVWGTCAGCILLSDDVVNSAGTEEVVAKLPEAKRCKYGEQVGGLQVSTCRNFFGRQEQSFEAHIEASKDSTDVGRRAFDDYPAVFIRAPAILRIGDGARALARVRHPTLAKEYAEDGVIVAAESERLLVTAFHPELTSDSRIHRYFVERFVLGNT
jgi:5'-phosphate synthase pdxT subunit